MCSSMPRPPDTTVDRIAALARTHALINPAATQRQIHALAAQLLNMTTSKSQYATRTRIPQARTIT